MDNGGGACIDGIPWYIGNFVHGIKHGLWKWSWDDGSLAFEKNYVDGQLEGEHIDIN